MRLEGDVLPKDLRFSMDIRQSVSARVGGGLLGMDALGSGRVTWVGWGSSLGSLVVVTSREGASERSKVCSVEQAERKRWGMRRERKASPAVVCAPG
jgi:hypothetical protein